MATTHNPGLTHDPAHIVGYRADGRPIFPIAGGAPDVAPAGGTVVPTPPVNTPGTTGAAPTLTHSGSVNRLREIRAQMAQIAELDQPSAQDDAYFRELADEFDTVDAHRLRLERSATLARVSASAETVNVAGYLRAERGAGGERHGNDHGYDRDGIMDPDSIENHRFRNPWEIDGVRTFGRAPDEVATEWKSRALSACEKMPGANDKIRQAATNIIERWDDQDASLSQIALALSAPDYYRAWCKLAKADGLGADLTEDERKSVAHVRHVARSTRAMSLTDTAGGYLVPFQLDPTVIIAANGSVNQIRQVARQVVAIGDVWHGVSSGAVSWSYDPEAAEVSDDSPTFAQPSIPIFKAQGFVPISIEAMQDAPNVAADIGNLLAFGRDVLEANAFSMGAGGTMPTGLITALTGTPQVVSTKVAATFGVGDVYALQGALPSRYRNQPDTAWLGNNLTYNMIRGFGTYFAMWGALADSRQPALLGRPALESEDMVATTTTNSNILVHGDFSNYVIADRIGMTVEFIPHLFGATRRPTGQRGWLAYVRHGADVVNAGAFRMLKVG